jgi:uncharacterized protein (TIGR03000 family)
MVRSSHSCRIALMLCLALIAAPALWSQALVQQEAPASIVVRVDPSAKLTVEGKVTQATGERRQFVSPPLKPGKRYVYTFVAEWDKPTNNYETYIVTRKVTVEAGKTVEVDMSKPDLQKGDTTLFIRWVATNPEVAEAMMKLAGVGKDDVVYDLGCGDGSLVITAVKKFNAKRGVGIDYKEDKVLMAKANAIKAGVANKVEFRQGDVLKDIPDLSKATVVTLYMSDELNERLLPTLQKQLKPGTRIVSHRFLMGDWKPEKTVTVDLAQEEQPDDKLIHLWTIPKK